MIHDLGLPFSEATIISSDQVFIRVMELGWFKINVCVYTGCINLCYIKYILHNKTGEIIMEHQDCNLLEKITFQSGHCLSRASPPTSDRSCWWIYQENLLVYFPVLIIIKFNTVHSSQSSQLTLKPDCLGLRKLFISTAWLRTTQSQCEVRTHVGNPNMSSLAFLSSLSLSPW